MGCLDGSFGKVRGWAMWRWAGIGLLLGSVGCGSVTVRSPFVTHTETAERLTVQPRLDEKPASPDREAALLPPTRPALPPVVPAAAINQTSSVTTLAMSPLTPPPPLPSPSTLPMLPPLQPQPQPPVPAPMAQPQPMQPQPVPIQPLPAPTMQPPIQPQPIQPPIAAPQLQLQPPAPIYTPAPPPGMPGSATVQDVMLIPRVVYVPYAPQTPTAPARMIGSIPPSPISPATYEQSGSIDPTREKLLASLERATKVIEQMDQRIRMLEEQQRQLSNPGSARIGP